MYASCYCQNVSTFTFRWLVNVCTSTSPDVCMCVSDDIILCVTLTLGTPPHLAKGYNHIHVLLPGNWELSHCWYLLYIG